jgi:DNA-binding SARP family transcriptional activator
VAMIGEIALFGGNEELSTIRLGNGIFRELFAFFVVERWRHPGRAWPARELIKRIWRVRARHHDELLNSFYVYISHMRALLKSSGFPGCLEHVREGYRIHRDCPIELDLQQFEAGLNEFKAKPGAFSVDDGIALLERYKHPIDSALTGKWLDELRAWHEQRWFALHERMFSKQIDQSQEKRLAILADRFYTD